MSAQAPLSTSRCIKSSRTVWRQDLHQSILTYHLYDDSLLVQLNTSVELFDALSGRLRWSTSVGQTAEVSLDGRGATFLQDRTVTCLDVKDGAKLWDWHPQSESGVWRSLASHGVIARKGSESVIVNLDQSGREIARSKTFRLATTSAGQDLILDGGKLAYIDPSSRHLRLQCVVHGTIKEAGPIAGKFERIQILDTNIAGFLARLDKGEVAIVEAGDGCTLSLRYTFPTETGDDLYAGYSDRQRQTYIARLDVNNSTTARLSVLELKSGTVQHNILPYDGRDGAVQSFTFEVADAATNFAYRALLYTAAPTLQLWRGHSREWHRHEALADTAHAVAVVDISDSINSSFVQPAARARLEQQLRSLLSHSKAVVRSLSDFIAPSKAVGGSSTDWLSRTFGFRQIAVLSTSSGQLIALDLSAGASVLWEHSFGQSLMWELLHVMPGGRQICALAKIGGGTTSGLCFDARAGPHAGAILATVMSGEPRTVFTLPDGTLAAADRDVHVHVYPLNLAQSLPSVYFQIKADAGLLRGYALEAGWSSGDVAIPTWSYATVDTIVSIVKPTTRAVASIGRVLGNRDTLYKYLNPHVLAVIGESSVSLLDGVSGAMVYIASFGGQALPSTPVLAALAENWLVYAFRDATLSGHPTRLVSVELYLHAEPNTTFSSFSDQPLPRSFSQSFVYPRAIRALSFTKTKHGITTINLIAAIEDGSVVSIPRRVLDPRRPMGKPSKMDQEEGLYPYDPLVPLEPRFSLSATDRVIFGEPTCLTSVPTLLESTSLVLSIGGDLFVTRTAPSGTFDVLSDEFNKIQLLLTMGALAIAIATTQPLVKRKQLRVKWYGS